MTICSYEVHFDMSKALKDVDSFVLIKLLFVSLRVADAAIDSRRFI